VRSPAKKASAPATRAKEKAKAKVLVPKGRNPDARVYEKPIVATEVIEAAANELRADHPKVTDEQAQFVHLLIQTGLSIPRICDAIGKNENWAYYHMSKAHVADYRQAVSIRSLGWASASALSTMRQLLDSPSQYIRLEASRDLLDRAGMRVEPVKATRDTVVMNFNLAPQTVAQGQASEPVEVVGEVLEHTAPNPQMGPGLAGGEDEVPFKNGACPPQRGNHTHDQGDGVASFSDLSDIFTA
jgi:hypothetical protein